jgi:hypothetical protein
MEIIGLDHVRVAAPIGSESDARQFYGALLGLLDVIALRLTEGGSTVQWDDSIPTARRFYTPDPWGNRIELAAA